MTEFIKNVIASDERFRSDEEIVNLGVGSLFCTRAFFVENGTKQDAVSDVSEIKKTDEGYEIKRVVTNRSNKPLRLKELLFRIDGFSFGENLNAQEDYYYVNENARLFCTLTLPIDFDREYPENPNNEKFGIVTSRQWTDVDILSDRICSCPY